MSVVWPVQWFGRFGIGMGFNYKLLNRRWGFDMGERYHKDPDYRIALTMEIDRAVFDAYGEIGLGAKDPAPRPSVEPFGHRFAPAMYGCEIRFGSDAEPWAEHRIHSEEEILGLEEWTPQRFEAMVPVRETAEQAKYLQSKYGHFGSLPNLGAPLTTAMYMLGDDLFVYYHERPDLVRRVYDNITDMMLICMDYFQALDGVPLSRTHLGNCCVSMISPDDYMRCNYDFDRTYMEYCRDHGIAFEMHQDSDVTPHLDNYARLDYTSMFDFGMDTDFERLAELFPNAQANCIWFPQWIMSHSVQELRDEARRVMDIGRRFPRFSQSLYEIDLLTSDEKVFALYDAVRGE